jgi:hypothetical protein
MSGSPATSIESSAELSCSIATRLNPAIQQSLVLNRHIHQSQYDAFATSSGNLVLFGYHIANLRPLVRCHTTRSCRPGLLDASQR